jgi:hypothetical protein
MVDVSNNAKISYFIHMLQFFTQFHGASTGLPVFSREVTNKNSNYYYLYIYFCNKWFKYKPDSDNFPIIRDSNRTTSAKYPV